MVPGFGRTMVGIGIPPLRGAGLLFTMVAGCGASVWAGCGIRTQSGVRPGFVGAETLIISAGLPCLRELLMVGMAGLSTVRRYLKIAVSGFHARTSLLSRIRILPIKPGLISASTMKQRAAFLTAPRHKTFMLSVTMIMWLIGLGQSSQVPAFVRFRSSTGRPKH